MNRTKTVRRPSLGAVAGVLALAVACSGGAYAAGAKITHSSQIKAGVVKSSDVKDGNLKVKDLNDSTVEKLEPTVEAWHVVGEMGQPSFEATWGPFNNSYQQPGFRIDEGVVHLRGAAGYGSDNAAGSVIYTLPPGYRPTACSMFDVATFNGAGSQDTRGAVLVCPNGNVYVYDTGDDRFVSLEGVSFSIS